MKQCCLVEVNAFSIQESLEAGDGPVSDVVETAKSKRGGQPAMVETALEGGCLCASSCGYGCD